MATQNDITNLVQALTFYSDVLETIRRPNRKDKKMLDAQEHLVYAIDQLTKAAREQAKTLIDKGD